MKILWIIKGPIPKASNAFGLPISAKEGWLIQTARRLADVKDIEFSIAFFESRLQCQLQQKAVGNIIFWGIQSPEDMESITEMITASRPDVIHIWGTENSIALRVTECCKKIGISDKVVISIQGLVSVYAQHYMGHLPWKVQVIPSLRDIVRKDTLMKQQKDFYKRGEQEKQAFRNVLHVIGRTTWDYVCVKQFNESVQYHFNNETLRPSFYQRRWSLVDCERYSIFVSQAQFPIKGFHHMLDALALVLEHFPQAHLYVGGANNSFKSGALCTAYGAYLQKMMQRYHLTGRVTYLGMLQEKAMCERFLQSHVFVSPSIIENSPNSVGEAMLLGMPVVSSMVGGVPDLMVHGKEGFIYQSDAPYMLAHYICSIFDDDKLAERLGENAHYRARKTHDPQKNLEQLLSIYSCISRRKS